MKFGVHVSKTSKINGHSYKDLSDAIEAEVKDFGLSAIQIFTNVPQSGMPAKMNHEAVKKYCNTNDIVVYVHAPYTSVSLWRIGWDTETDQDEKQLNRLDGFMTLAEKVGAAGLVVHLPKRSVQVIVDTIKTISADSRFRNRVPLILEMPASKPDECTYETADKLNTLTTEIAKHAKIEWGICVDTAHQWSCKIRMDDKAAVDKWIADLSDLTKKKIKLIHLNGAAGANFGTGKDVHHIPFAETDAIWGKLISKSMREFMKKNADEMSWDTNSLYRHLRKEERNVIGASTMQSLVNWAREYDYDIVCEINMSDMLDSKLAIDILNHLTDFGCGSGSC